MVYVKHVQLFKNGIVWKELAVASKIDIELMENVLLAV